MIKNLVPFLGHEDASALTADDLLKWKSTMVEAGLRPKTVRDAKLAPVRAILQWGVQNQLIGVNVAEKVTIDVRAKQGEKKRSFTDEEGRMILRAALGNKVCLAAGCLGLVLTLAPASLRSVSFDARTLSRLRASGA